MSESIPDNFEPELEVNSGENGLDGSEISFVIGQSVELPTMDESKRPNIGYEYVDHTADIQLHAWAPKLQDAFIQCAYAMFAYMTDLDTVDIASSVELQAEATGDGLDSLLYHFLDELLFHFSAEYFVPKTIEITKFDREALKIDVTISGEDFELSKHPQNLPNYELLHRQKVEHAITHIDHSPNLSRPDDVSLANRDENKNQSNFSFINFSCNSFDPICRNQNMGKYLVGSNTLLKKLKGTEVKAITYSNLQIHEKENMCDVFVIVDI